MAPVKMIHNEFPETEKPQNIVI